MALELFSNLWPFSILKFDDLKASDTIIHKLSIPESTKQFVFAIQEPESQSVIYILCAQNLSERSASDAEILIRELRPDVVVAQVAPETKCQPDFDESVPTSSFGVIIKCFMHKINKEKFENMAGNSVLREIFGVSLNGHFSAAKRAADDIGSSFLLLESPCVRSNNDPMSESNVGNKYQSLGMQPNSLIQRKAGSVVTKRLNRFLVMDEPHLKIVKSLSSFMKQSDSKLSPARPVSELGSARLDDIEPRCNYQAPPFAQSVYPLLLDLHNIFVDLPSVGRALAHSQKILLDIDKGGIVDTKLLSEIYTFRVAVEGLRIALNNAGRVPLRKMKKANSGAEFSELPVVEKSHIILAQALRSQTKKFKSIVAVVDASSFADLRKHWNAPVPLEVKDMIEKFLENGDNEDGFDSNEVDKKGLLGKPVVAVGAGATAVLGASSFSKVVPASTLVKVVTFKVPASLKLILTHTHKAITMALGKVVGPTKVVVGPAKASSSILKATASAEKIRAAAHSMIASAEKTSFSAMRTAFYEIMRSRRVRPVGFLPWATFGCSVATCTGLLVYGDGIECAAESLPSAPSIASLGRGVRSLHLASEEARQTESTKIQKSIELLMHRLKSKG